MSPFFRKIAVFLSIPIGLVIFSHLLLNYLNNKKFSDYKLGSNITSVFIGDSHIQKSIIDTLLNQTVNLSQASESYYHSYFKIQKILHIVQSIDKIYLGFNYHSLSSYYDDFIYGKYAVHTSPRYFYILPFQEKLATLNNNSDDLPHFIRQIYWLGIKNLFGKKNDLSFLGKYENEFRTVSANKKFMDLRLSFQYYVDDEIRPFSNINLYYLYKIVNLCGKNNIDLVMIKTPMHNYYKTNIPNQYLKKYEKIINDNQLELINFDNEVFSDSCFIPDGDHVSQLGALKVTDLLRNVANF